MPFGAKMKATPKLRRYITRPLAAIILLMIVAYSLLVYYSLFSGIEESASYDLRLKARDFAQSYRGDMASPLPKTKYLSGYLGIKEIPNWLQKDYDVESFAHGKLVMGNAVDAQIHNGEEFFFLAMAYELYDQKRLYLIETYTQEDEIPGTFTKINRAIVITLCLGIGFILSVGLALRYFFHKISSPINALNTWAKGLNREKLEHPPPDFHFAEINQLADLIQNAIGDLNQALIREHHFLRNASHELRTPIAVIRTNMDLLARLQPEPGDKEKIVHNRIRRAVDNMHRLTETLLWLSRKEETMPSPESININEMVEELVRENRYLLSGKEVDLNMEVGTTMKTLPRAALYIVLGNLIRNAFQYTSQGAVNILVNPTAVTIINVDQSQRRINPAGGEYGFGLGLMLVDQITKKLNLSCQKRIISGGYEVILFLSQSES